MNKQQQTTDHRYHSTQIQTKHSLVSGIDIDNKSSLSSSNQNKLKKEKTYKMKNLIQLIVSLTYLMFTITTVVSADIQFRGSTTTNNDVDIGNTNLESTDKTIDGRKLSGDDYYIDDGDFDDEDLDDDDFDDYYYEEEEDKEEDDDYYEDDGEDY